MSAPILEARGLCRRYTSGSKEIIALDGVDLELSSGEILGVVGASGSGKSTLARCLVMLEKPDAGSIVYRGNDLAKMSERQLRPLRSRFQMVFQDPGSALNPRMTVRQALTEPFRIHPKVFSWDEEVKRVDVLLESCGLSKRVLEQRTHELSGGQKQRVCLARALALQPDWLVLDEPVTALDVSVQAQILNLLVDLRDQWKVGMILISHDLAVIQAVSGRIAVLDRGRWVEVGLAHQIIDSPKSDVTMRLLEASALMRT